MDRWLAGGSTPWRVCTSFGYSANCYILQNAVACKLFLEVIANHCRVYSSIFYYCLDCLLLTTHPCKISQMLADGVYAVPFMCEQSVPLSILLLTYVFHQSSITENYRSIVGFWNIFLT